MMGFAGQLSLGHALYLGVGGYSAGASGYPLIGVPWSDKRVIARANGGGAFDMPAIHIYKVWGGHIHEIEAIGIVMAYQSPTGWEP